MLWLAATLPARAAEPANPKAPAAEALFEEAQALVAAGRYAEACPKFRQSQELDPAGGTLLNLGDCYEREGKLASAWSTFKAALGVAERDRHDERMRYATERIEALGPRLVRITIQVPERARAPGLDIRLDGADLGAAAWGVPLPVDPGEHRLSARAPGKRPFELRFETTSTNENRSIEIPVLEAEPESAAPDARELAAPAPKPRPNPASRPALGAAAIANDHASSSRTAGFIVGGVGVAALGVGSYFGVRAFSRWDERKDACEPVCNRRAVDAAREARTAATVADVAFATALGAFGVATYLIWFSDDSARSATAPPLRVDAGGGPGRGAIQLRGRF